MLYKYFVDLITGPFYYISIDSISLFFNNFFFRIADDQLFFFFIFSLNLGCAGRVSIKTEHLVTAI